MSAALHIVPLPEGARAVPGPGFAMIFEIGEDPHPDAKAITEWKAFARDCGAAGLFITTRDLVILGPHHPAVPPGPCPSYMEGLGVAHLCDLRFGHDGLHEETKPGADGHPAQHATWGERERWDQSAAGGFTGVIARDKVIDLSTIPLGVCRINDCERPTLVTDDDLCEVHRP